MSRYVVGQVRPSQLLWTYGPGALIDLPNLSVLTMGLDRWNTELCHPVEERRLLAAVQRVLGHQVVNLRLPPFIKEEIVDPRSAEANIGIPVKPFPRWLRCVKCGLLSEYDSGLFKIEANQYRPEQTHFVHTNCEKGRNADAVPARFLLACRNGHLDDFPWHWFVHGGPSQCKGTLRFFERGASLQTENLWVKCDTCDAARSLVHAFGSDSSRNLPACRGRHPHLESHEECSEEPRTILLGATNGWFPVTISALAIPLEGDLLSQFISDGWTYFSNLQTREQLDGMLMVMTAGALLPGIEKFANDDIWEAIRDRKEGKTRAAILSEGDMKDPEWRVLTSEEPPTDWPHFMSERTETPVAYKNIIANVLLLNRLREVNALIGYTRVEAPEESASPDERPPMARLCRAEPEWVPANEIHGEGIFMRFDESVTAEWERHQSVRARSAKLEHGHRAWRNARHLNPAEGYPGIRYAMLHTFSHFLIREFALECGYNAASIRERIYAKNGDALPMAGILLYTAAADSDGTLGGLVELGKPDNLGRLIDQALDRAAVCSSDPLCSEHDPAIDRTLHSAACHACTFLAETSCERGNRYLDRALVVPTLECADAAFFTMQGGRHG